MERDPEISRLIREDGVVPAPEGFTRRVMDIIASVPEKKAYKPLIGFGGRIMITLFVIATVVISLIFAEPAEQTHRISELVPNLNWQLPKLNLNFDFISGMHLSSWVVSVLVAVLILVFTDARIRRRNLTH